MLESSPDKPGRTRGNTCAYLQMKTEKAYKKWIEQTAKKWSPKLKLENYIIKVEKGKDTEYLACKYSYPYLSGTIQYSDASYKDWKIDPITEHEPLIIHELCHLITDPFYTKACERHVTKQTLEDERERLTDHIAVVVYKNFKKL